MSPEYCPVTRRPAEERGQAHTERRRDRLLSPARGRSSGPSSVSTTLPSSSGDSATWGQGRDRDGTGATEASCCGHSQECPLGQKGPGRTSPPRGRLWDRALGVCVPGPIPDPRRSPREGQLGERHGLHPEPGKAGLIPERLSRTTVVVRAAHTDGNAFLS